MQPDDFFAPAVGFCSIFFSRRLFLSFPFSNFISFLSGDASAPLDPFNPVDLVCIGLAIGARFLLPTNSVNSNIPRFCQLSIARLLHKCIRITVIIDNYKQIVFNMYCNE